MKRTINKVTTASLLALTTTIITGVTPPPASAQVNELLSVAGSALSSLGGNRNQQPIQQAPISPVPTPQAPVNREVTVGTNNLNGNNLNLCLATCTPNTPTPPQGLRPVTPLPPQGMPPQGLRPGTPLPPQGMPPQANAQPPAPRPTLIIPPVRLPINMPR